MGRAKGGVQAAAGLASLPRTPRPAKPASLGVGEAAINVQFALGRARKVGSFAGVIGNADALKLAEVLLQKQETRAQGIDFVLADLAETVRHPELERALEQYLASRLAADRKFLVEAGVMEGSAARAIRGHRVDDRQAWAALRAADLLRARAKVNTAALGGDEAERARAHVADRCLSNAEAQLTALRPPAHRYQLRLLSAARGLTDPGLAEARHLLYEEGTLERTRAAMTEDGLETDAPVVFTNFPELGYTFGYFDDFFEEDVAGFCDKHNGLVALNGQLGLEMLQRSCLQGELDTTLVHELVHTRQIRADEGDDDETLDDQETLAESALDMALMEGATDSEARLLVRGTVEDVSGVERGVDADDPWGSAYREERMFVSTLAELGAAGQPDLARAHIRALALSGEGERVPMAAQMLLERSDSQALAALRGAYWNYQERFNKLYDQAHSGQMPPRHWRPPQAQTRELAQECLREMLADPDGYAAR